MQAGRKDLIVKLYMRTTKDKYQLPVAVADSPKELAKMVGTSPGVVRSCISRKKLGWASVEIPDEEMEEEKVEHTGDVSRV